MDTLIRFGTYYFDGRRQISIDSNFGEQRTVYFDRYGIDGAYDEYGLGAARAALGSVAMEFWLIGEPYEMDDKRLSVNALQAVGVQRLVMLPNGRAGAKARYCKARCVDVNMPQLVHQLPHRRQRVKIRFEASEPYWLEDTRHQVPRWGAFVWGGAKWGGVEPRFVLSVSEPTIRLVTKGTVPTKPAFSLSPTGGSSIQNPKLQRRLDGAVVDEVKWTGTLQAGDVLRVDPSGYSAKLNDVDTYANLTILRRDRWFEVPPGESNLVVMGDSWTGNIDLMIDLQSAYW